MAAFTLHESVDNQKATNRDYYSLSYNVEAGMHCTRMMALVPLVLPIAFLTIFLYVFDTLNY